MGNKKCRKDKASRGAGDGVDNGVAARRMIGCRDHAVWQGNKEAPMMRNAAMRSVWCGILPVVFCLAPANLSMAGDIWIV